jgi:membrane protease YdiL (CAAX protease family)
MTDPDLSPGPPLVQRVAEEVPLVARVAAPLPPRPRPGLVVGGLLTVGFAVVLFGTMIGIVVVAFLLMAITGDIAVLDTPEGAKPGSLASLPPRITQVVAWSIVIAYAAGLMYSILVLRVIVGRNWFREAGLRRFPLPHFLLGLIALPGFVVLSDALARFFFWVTRMENLMDQSGDLGSLFRPFHWSFTVLAIGIGPGVVEELWCRGFLGRGFVGRCGWVGGVLLTSLTFGMLHAYPPPYVMVTAVMGVGLHFTYAMSRSLWVPMTIHTLNNSFAALTAVGTIPTAQMEQVVADHPALVLGLAIGTVLLAGLAMWTGRARVVADPTGPPPLRGVMVPTGPSGHLSGGMPSWALAAAAGLCSGGLVWALFG